MSRKISLVKEPYFEGDYVFKKELIIVREGLTVLVGCNGSGKTTFHNQIEKDLTKREIPFIKYDNNDPFNDTNIDSLLFHGNCELASQRLTNSEGENINHSLNQIVGRIGNKVRSLTGINKEFWLLLDAIDSGLSIDYIAEYKEFIKNFLVKELSKQNIKLYAIITANEYEMARGETCLDIVEGKYLNFKDYEDYRKFILESRIKKDKRYEIYNQLIGDKDE